MNAVISANTLDWRSSSAFNKAFAIDGLDVDAVLQFNARATFDPAFKSELVRDFAGALSRYDLAALDPSELDPAWQERLSLADDEFAVLDEITERLSGRGIDASLALERSTAGAGVGVPAIAVLILVVVVVVFVVITHPGNPD